MKLTKLKSAWALAGIVVAAATLSSCTTTRDGYVWGPYWGSNYAYGTPTDVYYVGDTYVVNREGFNRHGWSRFAKNRAGWGGHHHHRHHHHRGHAMHRHHSHLKSHHHQHHHHHHVTGGHAAQ